VREERPDAIIARDIGVRYDLRLTRHRTIRQTVAERVRQLALRRTANGVPATRTEFWALRGVSFRLASGEVLGVVGRNGSGKSTLLLTIAGILRPDTGFVTTAGRTATLLTLGAGFEPRLTGRDNIYLNGAYLGFTHRKMDAIVDEIIEFSELGTFIDAPVTTYSAGMRARLGFSIAAFAEPDILLLDEVLGVGDAAFQHKSRGKMRELMERASALVIVSHSTDFILETCTRALWLDGGTAMAYGTPDEVVAGYTESVRRSRGPIRTVFDGAR
jgi:ABC-type polysaccharide/polyol phosphate transport system ATPase subunit